jgi:mono/diheme cytochrome c family protein
MKKRIQSILFISALVLGMSFLFTSTRAENALSTVSLTSLTQDETTKLYDKNCAKCHGKDGRAKSFRGKMVNAQDFTDKSWQESTSDDEMNETIKNGHGKMPAFGKKLTDDLIKALVTYIRAFKK